MRNIKMGEEKSDVCSLESGSFMLPWGIGAVVPEQ